MMVLKKSQVILASILFLVIIMGITFIRKQKNVEVERKCIDQSASHNGVTMTIEKTLMSNTNGMIEISLIRDNQETFKDNAQLKKFKLSLNDKNKDGESSSYSTNWELSKDNKKLKYQISFRADGRIDGSKATVKGENIVLASTIEKDMPIELEKMAVQPVDNDVNLEHLNKDLILKKVSFKKDKLTLNISYKPTEEELWQVVKLVDTRTGDVVLQSAMSNKVNEELEEAELEYKDIKSNDLRYLKLVVVHTDYEVLVPGEWCIDFIIPTTKEIKRSRGQYDLLVGDEKLVISYVEISPIGGIIKGKMINNEVNESNIALWMKDGSKLQMRSMGLFYGEHTFSINIGVDDIISEQIIDIEKVEGIQIGNRIIPLY